MTSETNTNVDPADIPVVILCGGQGTRIREASEKLPKPLIDIGGKPVLWHIMKTYGAHGFRKFVLCLGYKSWDIKEYFLRYQENVSDFTINVADGSGPRFHERADLDDWDVSLVDTGMHTGTGGRLARVAHLLDAPYFMVSYGDGVGAVDVAGQLQAIVTDPSMLAMVTGVHPTSRYGELATEGNKVIDFAEKLPSDGWVSGGFFAFRHEFLDRLLPDPSHFFEQGPMQDLARENALGLWEHRGFWMGMDTYREYSALNEMWSKNEAEWKIW